MPRLNDITCRRSAVERLGRLLLLCLVCSPLLSAEAQNPPAEPGPAIVIQDPREMELTPVGSDSEYKLGVGDRIQVIVAGHEDLSGEFVIDGKGQFFMPLIDEVDATGLNPAELEQLIVEKLKPDYLVNPRVNIRCSSTGRIT